MRIFSFAFHSLVTARRIGRLFGAPRIRWPCCTTTRR
jgi:hypothetical protein